VTDAIDIPAQHAALGTYTDGRDLTYDHSVGQFYVGGTPVSVDDVRAYDGAGHLVWHLDASRGWFHGSFPVAVAGGPGAVSHSVPKCLHCGYEGPWRVESLLLPHH